jgi:hypothetical protein
MISQPFERVARAGEAPHRDRAAAGSWPRRALAADNYDEAIDGQLPHGGADQAQVGPSGQRDSGAERVDGRGAAGEQEAEESALDAVAQRGELWTWQRRGCAVAPLAFCGRVT